MREEEEQDCADAAAAPANPSDTVPHGHHQSTPEPLPPVVEDSETEDQAQVTSGMAVHTVPSVVADSEEDDDDQHRRRAFAISRALQQERGSCSQAEKDGRLPAFMTARALLAENIWGKEVFLSPGFRSVAALAGWDDESLLIAAVEGSNGLIPANEKPAITVSPVVCQSPQPSGTRMRTRDRKREERTPQQAATPLSAGRRHRRARRQAIHGCSPEALPIGDLSLNEEFQREVNGPCADKRVEVQDVERGKPISSADHTASSLQAQAETVLPIVADSEGGSSNAMAAIDKGPSTEDHLKNQSSTGLHQSQEEFPGLDNKGVFAEADSKDQKPSCLDQLRDELSCAVCLDICFEPSTTSCGHSFCRGCLRSVLEKCGPRCPKCRQQLKGDTWRSCPVNVVLWNTVQLLFPMEMESRAVAAREAEKKKQAEGQACGCREESATAAAATRGTREAWQRARPPPAGLRRRGDRWGFIRQGPVMVGGHWSAGEDDDDAEVVVARPRSQSSHGSSNSRRRRQEQADAALARRLHQAELAQAQGGSSNASTAVTATTTTIASAAANLRTVAYRAVRHQSFRSRH